MNVQGKIKVIGQTETIGVKAFRKRLVVIETSETYPQLIPIEFTQDKTSLLDAYKVDEYANVSINLRGSEWQGKYYANIQGWKIERAEAEKSSDSFMPDRAPINNAQATEDETDSLPF